MRKTGEVAIAALAIAGILLFIPIVVAYGFLVHWLLVTIGLPDDGAKVMTLFSYILMFALICGAAF